jgi:hypothetical protein
VPGLGVITLNVCGLPSGLLAPRLRAVELCRRLESSDAAVVNLQEVWTRRLLRTYRAGLPSYRYAAWRRGLAGQPAGGLVTFCRVPMRTLGYRSFGGLRPSTGTPVFRAAKAINSGLQGVLVTELTEHRTVVANTHLSANRDGDWSPTNRHVAFQRAQLLALHEAVRRLRPPDTRLTILTGDLNVASSSTLYDLVTEHGAWADPFAGTDPPTFHASLLLPRDRTPRRIDYLLAYGPGPVPIDDAAVLFADQVPIGGTGDAYLSDHVGLTARVTAG